MASDDYLCPVIMWLNDRKEKSVISYLICSNKWEGDISVTLHVLPNDVLRVEI